MIKGNSIFSLKLNFVMLKHPTNLHKVSRKMARAILSWCCQQFWSAAAALWWSSEWWWSPSWPPPPALSWTRWSSCPRPRCCWTRPSPRHSCRSASCWNMKMLIILCIAQWEMWHFHLWPDYFHVCSIAARIVGTIGGTELNPAP